VPVGVAVDFVDPDTDTDTDTDFAFSRWQQRFYFR